MELVSGTSPKFTARLAGSFYLITFVAGIAALVLKQGQLTANLIATVAYVAVTILFYDLFRSVSRRLSLLAALVGLVGCGWGALAIFDLAPLNINSLVFFGFYCLLIGYLILRSTFLPRFLGALMMLGGLGWLTFISPSLSSSLSPYNMAPAILGEGVLMVWLIVAGVNVQRWREQAAL
jgi:hypothetical protein